eukprot:278979_1
MEQDNDYYKTSASASIAAAKPIFSDGLLKVPICFCYFIQFVFFMNHLLLQPDSNELLMGAIYYNDILYRVNEIFFRSFVAMCLISVFFTFVSIFNEKHITPVNYIMLYKLWKNKRYQMWIGLFIFIIFLPFEVFHIRNTQLFLHHFINTFWIVINCVASFILFTFSMYLIFEMYEKIERKSSRLWHESTAQPVIPFALEGVVLLCLCFVYTIYICPKFHFIENNKNAMDRYRQCCIMILLVFQFIVLVCIKKIQLFGITYVNKFKRLTPLYRFMCLLLVYNIIYVFMFNVQYFSKSDCNDKKDKKYIAGLFSFSQPTAMLFMLSHFLHSFNQWEKDKTEYENDSNNRFEDTSFLNKFQEQKSA